MAIGKEIRRTTKRSAEPRRDPSWLQFDNGQDAEQCSARRCEENVWIHKNVEWKTKGVVGWNISGKEAAGRGNCTDWGHYLGNQPAGWNALWRTWPWK